MGVSFAIAGSQILVVMPLLCAVCLFPISTSHDQNVNSLFVNMILELLRETSLSNYRRVLDYCSGSVNVHKDRTVIKNLFQSFYTHSPLAYEVECAKHTILTLTFLIFIVFSRYLNFLLVKIALKALDLCSTSDNHLDLLKF